MSNQGGLRGMVRRRLLSDFERGVLDDIRQLDERIEDLERQEFSTPDFLGGGGLTLIETQTKTSAEAHFDFASISQAFRHLLLLTNTRGDTGALDATSFGLQYNGDATSGDYNTRVWHTGDPLLWATSVLVAVMVMHPLDAALPSDNWGTGMVVIPHYVTTDKNKSTFGFGHVSTGTDSFDRILSYSGGQWQSADANDAITDIRVTDSAASGIDFAIGSRVDLFGFGTA